MRTPAEVFRDIRAHYASPRPDTSTAALAGVVNRALREAIAADPDPAILQQLIESGRAEGKR